LQYQLKEKCAENENKIDNMMEVADKQIADIES
jgi:hypothetical protein